MLENRTPSRICSGGPLAGSVFILFSVPLPKTIFDRGDPATGLNCPRLPRSFQKRHTGLGYCVVFLLKFVFILFFIYTGQKGMRCAAIYTFESSKRLASLQLKIVQVHILGSSAPMWEVLRGGKGGRALERDTGGRALRPDLP